MTKTPTVTARLDRRTCAEKRRQGATLVEFAVVSPVFFLLLFACIYFGRVMMLEAFIEESAFQAARHVSVFGATVAEGVAVAESELAVLGVNNAAVQVTPFSSGVQQAEITIGTDTIRVTVRAPIGGNFIQRGVMNVQRTVVIRTERF